MIKLGHLFYPGIVPRRMGSNVFNETLSLCLSDPFRTCKSNHWTIGTDNAKESKTKVGNSLLSTAITYANSLDRRGIVLQVYEVVPQVRLVKPGVTGGSHFMIDWSGFDGLCHMGWTSAKIMGPAKPHHPRNRTGPAHWCSVESSLDYLNWPQDPVSAGCQEPKRPEGCGKGCNRHLGCSAAGCGII